MDLLVLGGSGFLGSEVIRQALRGRHRVAATFHSRELPIADVDWRHLDLSARAVAAGRPSPR
ncbi:NAD(P)-dependent oxidoreductase [Natronosporangium hydrolyticum]|uniref:NAD(P)-dependent oxidoreductase n=1 Tax=Natronosporangium hydrolyticum TaxID=2811111 RepID=A0A895YQH2_9ACTN|nr:NAD(P)-dependent oxidoreductase [Natronosporangium hydrolyticum]